MILFLVTAVPISTILLLFIFFPGRMMDREMTASFLKGMLWFIPFLVVSTILQRLFPMTFTSRGIFSHYYFHDYFLPSLVALTGHVIFFGSSSRTFADQSPAETTMYFCGYFSLMGILEMIIRFSRLDIQVLFFRPVLFVSLILLLSMTSYSAFSTNGWRRGLLFFGAVAVSAVPALVPTLYRMSFEIISLLLCLACLAAGLFFFELLGKKARRI